MLAVAAHEPSFRWHPAPKPLRRKPEPAMMPAMEHADWNRSLNAVAIHADRAAFARLYGHFGPRVKAFLMSRKATPAEAEDLVQECFVTVWNKAGQFDAAKASAATWIFTIARNKHIDRIRRTVRPDLDEHEPALQPTPERAQDELLEIEEDVTRVRAALATLPADQQDVLRLAFMEELSHTDIADRLKLPLGTVKSRIRLGFARLRDRLKDD